jgi:hypothetical protein
MDKKDYLKDISDIKDIMNRSTRFMSLSGISGILAGIYALAGGFAANYLLTGYGKSMYGSSVLPLSILELILIGIAIVVALLSIGTAYLFTKKKAKKNNEKIWTSSSKQLMSSFMIPMLAGGIFTLLLVYRGYYGLIAPITLVFYGLALINASKNTLSLIKYLGWIEIILGLIAMVYFGNGILFWMLGFGVLHIIYGTLIYFKFDKAS